MASKTIQNVRIEGYDGWKYMLEPIERYEIHGTLDEDKFTH